MFNFFNRFLKNRKECPEHIPVLWLKYLGKNKYPRLNILFHYFESNTYKIKEIETKQFSSKKGIIDIQTYEMNCARNEIEKLNKENKDFTIEINEEIEKIQKSHRDRWAFVISQLLMGGSIIAALLSVYLTKQTVEITKETAEISKNAGSPYIDIPVTVWEDAEDHLGVEFKFINHGNRPASNIRGIYALVSISSKKVLSLEKFSIPNDIVPQESLSAKVTIPSKRTNRKNHVLIVGYKYTDALGLSARESIRYTAITFSNGREVFLYDMSNIAKIKDFIEREIKI